MTLADLLTELGTHGALPASRVKDLKTSLRYLASALGQPSLEACPVADACRDPTAWTGALETHFQALMAQGRTISAATRRNTRNNLRVAFRLAEERGLIKTPLPPRLLSSRGRRVFLRQQRATAPYQTTYANQTGPRRFTLPQAQWPPEIQAGWRDYQARCGFRLRATTLHSYATHLATYLGYLANIAGRTPTWGDVFDTALLMDFVRWHGARLGRPVSTHGQHVVNLACTIANVCKHSQAPALADMRNTLKPPPPLHIKRVHWVSLRELEEISEACLAEGRSPYLPFRLAKHPGARRATQFQRGVILKLLVRVPLRQRNVRELRVGENLYADHKGHWQLHFSGAELKIGTRGGQVNEYNLNLTEYAPELLPLFEEWRTVYRPRLPNAATSPFLFLTQRGTPHTVQTLREELTYIVARHTGQRFYPHLIRTIWATEFLEKTQNFTTAATMLGDTLAVVMKTYYDIVHKDHHAQAKAFLGTALHAG
jgi:hypothetical protein